MLKTEHIKRIIIQRKICWILNPVGYLFYLTPASYGNVNMAVSEPFKIKVISYFLRWDTCYSFMPFTKNIKDKGKRSYPWNPLLNVYKAKTQNKSPNKPFDKTTIADPLRMVSWSYYSPTNVWFNVFHGAHLPSQHKSYVLKDIYIHILQYNTFEKEGS